MKLPFKPHLLVLLCSAGLFAASGVMFVKGRATEPAAPAPVAQQPAAPVPAAAQPAPVAAPTYTAAQIDQWVAPIALYPDALLSQILMASTYPSNVIQAAQWSKDNPKMEGDAAIQAVASQPWDPSVKSLVAFPQLMSLMGENPPWVQNLGDAFLAQPKDVMDSVQRLRALAQKTGALQSTPQQTVTTVTKPAPAKTSTTEATTTAATTPAPAPTVIKIESADPQVVYVPTYNPNTVYGTWPNTAYPPTYLPPSPGEQFGNSFVNGLGFSLGVATTYAIFSNIDWDDDDDWDHHHDDWDNHGGYNRNGDNNININVENFNKISGQRLTDANRTWQHNPAYREGVPYPTNQLNTRFHSTNTATGLSSTQQKPVNRDSQRQAALSQMEKSTGKTFPQTARPGSKDVQRQASAEQLKQISQRNNYRGYDTKSQTAKRTTTQQRENRQTAAQRQEKRVSQPAQLRAHQQRSSQPRANALSGNDSRSANWQAQQQRGAQSRQLAARQHQPRQFSGERAERREFRHR
ncbi:DUF3300 domain-containing protein [Enterobacter chuandaensis]|uniref:DUF3300 domain-containing protein n=1 Tax=Enterobacter chuandaensis TaxID=2497875 RepID=A0AA96M899_9ENTR|nr:DUF3300 domain-containing protein [Enterobacter chuandaensis]MCW4783562.1 DUF3300 domain-containing protein [Enterobacter chuandaensis]MDA4758142.1 DUF3300 domain-containing protein [Enterobacter chuandaensis]WNS38788.1 DUF3300 domain-containing protein [Enterobacter chuandaensis]